MQLTVLGQFTNIRIVLTITVFTFNLFALADDSTMSTLPEKAKTGISRTDYPKGSKKKVINKLIQTCRYCFLIGGGGDYLSFNQQSETYGKTIHYSSFGAPSLWADFRFKIFGPLGLRAEYQSQATGKIKSDTILLDSNRIYWTIATLGFDYKLKQFFRVYQRPVITSLLIAYQQHSMPFIFPVDDAHYNVRQFDFKTLSSGLYFDILVSKKWYLLWTNRLQVPIENSKHIKVHSGLSFDGAVGVAYHTNSGMVTSLYWGGQYHNYKYQTETDNGSYTLLTSKVNLLFGFFY
jgi:hypothetical protein